MTLPTNFKTSIDTTGIAGNNELDLFQGTTMTNDLTIENFHEKTGFRFRVTSDQKQKIKDGLMTREQAFAEFLASGGADNLKPRKPQIPNSVYLGDGLTIANFSDRVKEATGMARRFRMNHDQATRHKAGTLTREQALAENVALIKAGKQVVETE